VAVTGAGAPSAAAPTSAGAVPTTEATGTVSPGPTGAGTQPTTDPPATTDPPSGGRTLSSPAGSVVAECTGGQALLTSWSPSDGYKVDQVDAGPAVAAAVVFKKKASRVRMTVTCVVGVPTAVVLPL
jgi:serine/threonine-protein kinase